MEGVGPRGGGTPMKAELPMHCLRPRVSPYPTPSCRRVRACDRRSEGRYQPRRYRYQPRRGRHWLGGQVIGTGSDDRHRVPLQKDRMLPSPLPVTARSGPILCRVPNRPRGRQCCLIESRSLPSMSLERVYPTPHRLELGGFRFVTVLGLVVGGRSGDGWRAAAGPWWRRWRWEARHHHSVLVVLRALQPSTIRRRTVRRRTVRRSILSLQYQSL